MDPALSSITLYSYSTSFFWLNIENMLFKMGKTDINLPDNDF